ncbi:aminoglycoside 6-adenylyltransferase [Deinococcus malanensis]|uniref:aminoglycoside 6-adenylyltransferase n=1 Tax=Deinococcus malanensis TaxID=1706855 RepID=UPI00362511CB
MPDTLASIHVSARQRYHDLMAVLRERADVQALYLTGSLQREDQTADAWSDIDLTLVTRDPAAYRESEAWLREVASIDFRVLYTPVICACCFMTVCFWNWACSMKWTSASPTRCWASVLGGSSWTART